MCVYMCLPMNQEIHTFPLSLYPHPILHLHLSNLSKKKRKGTARTRGTQKNIALNRDFQNVRGGGRVDKSRGRLAKSLYTLKENSPAKGGKGRGRKERKKI